MFVPLRRAQIWRLHALLEERANEKQQRPDSLRGRLCNSHLSYPRFFIYKWLPFLVLVT